MKNPQGYLCLIVLAASVSIIQTQDLPPAQSIFMQGNNINAIFRTDGYFNCDKVTLSGAYAGFIWPASATSRLTAVYTSGIWIGAKVGPQRELRLAASSYNTHYSPGNIPIIGQVPPASVCNDPSWRGYYVQLTDPSLSDGGTRTKLAGGRQYTFNYDSWANWPVQKGAPYVEVNNIPGYQPSWNGDRPGIGNGMTARPDELLFMVYMDYTNCTNNIHMAEISLPGGTLPMGVEFQQLVFMFNCLPLRDMYFLKFRIINKSNLTWDSTFIGNVNDPDLGDGSDDALGCDTSREMGFCYNFDNNDPLYGSNPPAMGYRFLQSPLKYTGNNNDTAKLPYDTLVGFLQPGMFAFNQFGGINPCIADPDIAFRAYYFISGLNGCGESFFNPISGLPTRFRYDGNSCSRNGWFDSTSNDTRGFMSSGPFNMNSGDTQIVVLSYMITRDGGNNFQNVCALQSISDSALYHYYHDFRNCTPIGIQPVSGEIPQKFELHQNYPNPFNPMTKLKFQMPKSDFVKLTVFDVTGKEIIALVDEQLKPGIYETDWDASNYPSGVYFYSIITGSYSQTRKMVLIK
jgi:Secretion system C-terminal sorting domain